MRARALFTALTLVGLLAGCGSTAKPRPSTAGRHYHLQVSEIRPSCSATACTAHNVFVSKLPKLTRAQAIRWADRLAHQVSHVVLHTTCHRVPGGWRCQYAGRR